MNKKFHIAVAIAAMATSNLSVANTAGRVSGTEFNPAISLILDGRYTDYDDVNAEELPGFMIGGEAGLPDRGFSTGHNELTISSNVDDRFYAKFTAAIVEEGEGTEVELEEAFLETLGLGNGFTLKGGKFFSALGYLNQQHEHEYDFVDAPLVYQTILGGALIDTGVQARWLAPTDFYLELGAEVTTGSSFPGGENEDGNQGNTLFVKTGGDFNESSSWQLGLSHYSTEFDVREGGAHGGEEDGADIELENGESDISIVDFVYKWAPNGNPTERNFKFYAEYFQRDEEGEGSITEVDDLGNEVSATGDYDGEHDGFYVAAVYQFMPKWRVGVRFDQISSDNEITNFAPSGINADMFGEETGLGEADHDPESTSIMLDYSYSEFSRFRFQVSDTEFQKGENENVYSIQYIMSLGAHGAHRF